MGVSLSLPSFSPRPDCDRVCLRVLPSTQSRLGWWRSSQVLIDDKGAIVHGLNQRPHAVDIGQEYEEFVGVEVPRIPLLDPSASQLLVARANGSFFLVPPPEKFSRHLGAALIIGDRQHNCGAYSLKLGDVIRLGSVGLLVMEMRRPDGSVERVSARELLFLKDHGDELRNILFDEAAVTARGEFQQAEASAAASNGEEEDEEEGVGASAARPICYMCFESEDEPDNALIAPCDCLGDTRYVHLQCLRKWNDVQVEEGAAVLSTAQGAATCKVCKRRYKQQVMMPDGRIEPVLFQALPAPAVSFVIITKHDNNRSLFGTQYQVGLTRTGKTKVCPNGVVAPAATMGRSHQCDMVVNYRTVSTQHARLYFEGGDFYIEDLHSSNGTSLYLRRPLELPTRGSMKVKLGRTMMLLRFQRSYRFFSSSSSSRNEAEAADKVTEGSLVDVVPETERSTMSSSPRNCDIAPVKLRRFATRDFLERLTMLEGRRTMSTDTGMRLMGSQQRRFQIRNLNVVDDDDDDDNMDDTANQMLGDNGTVPESDVVFERARAMTAGTGFARRRGGHDIETISSVSSPSNITDRTRHRPEPRTFGRSRLQTAPEDNMSVRRSEQSELSVALEDLPEQLPQASSSSSSSPPPPPRAEQC